MFSHFMPTPICLSTCLFLRSLCLCLPVFVFSSPRLEVQAIDHCPGIYYFSHLTLFLPLQEIDNQVHYLELLALGRFCSPLSYKVTPECDYNAASVYFCFAFPQHADPSIHRVQGFSFFSSQSHRNPQMSICASLERALVQLFGDKSSRLPAHKVYGHPLVLLRFNSRYAFPFQERLLLGMPDCITQCIQKRI